MRIRVTLWFRSSFPCVMRKAFVADALASILAEEGVVLEVVVVDDGSRAIDRRAPSSTGLAIQTAVRVIDGPERGIARRRSTPALTVHVVISCRGCDADDLVHGRSTPSTGGMAFAATRIRCDVRRVLHDRPQRANLFARWIADKRERKFQRNFARA